MQRKVYVHLDGMGNQLINWSFEQLAADPTMPSEGQEWIDTVNGRRKVHRNGETKSYAWLSDLSSMANFVGSIDLSASNNEAIPTDLTDSRITLNAHGSARVSNGDNDFKSGDALFVSAVFAGGTEVTGVQGDDILSQGDFIGALDNAPTTPAQFYTIQSNIDEGTLYMSEQIDGVNLVANTPLVVSWVVFGAGSNISDVEVLDGPSGNVVTVGINGEGSDTITLEANVNVSGLTIIGEGTIS